MKFVQTLLPPTLVRDTLGRLGIEITEEKGDEYWALCPMHLARMKRVDHNASWSINAETGLHSCFSCKYKGNLFTLVRDLKGPGEARDFQGSKSVESLTIPDGFRVRRSVPIPKPDPVQALGMPESSLALFTDPPAWAREARGVSSWAVGFYGVRWSKEQDAWVLPLRNPDTNGLIGYQLKGQLEKITLNKPTGMNKGSTLFGYREVRVVSDVVMVVESPLDAMRLTGFGFFAVAVCGSRVSEVQLELLDSFDTVVFAMDNDDAGRLETERLRRLMPGFYANVFEYPEGAPKDFGEMDDDMLRISVGRQWP